MSVAIKSTGKLAIECACGARGTVDAARAAGRKLRCARCGETLTASGSGESVARTAPVEPALTLREPAPRPVYAQPDEAAARRMEERAQRRTSRRGGSGRGDDRRGRGEVGEAGSRDVMQEAHLRAIAVWQRISGFLGLLGCGLLLMIGVGGGAPGGALAVSLLPLLIVASVLLLLGHGLWSYWASARWVMLALQALPVLGGLHGLVTVPGAFKLVAVLQLAWPVAVSLVLLSARTSAICTPEYRALVERTPRVSVPWVTSPFFWIPAVILGVILLACLVLFGGAILALVAH